MAFEWPFGWLALAGKAFGPTEIPWAVCLRSPVRPLSVLVDLGRPFVKRGLRERERRGVDFGIRTGRLDKKPAEQADGEQAGERATLG